VEDNEAKLVIEVEPTRETCAGSAAAYLIRTIAARAGSYAPGIEERMFSEMERRADNLNFVEGWFVNNQDMLSYLGYRFLVRRVAFRTDGIVNWVKAGDGFRGALLPTMSTVLHPEHEPVAEHAVALIPGSVGGGSGRNGVVMVDPWPGAGIMAVPPDLDHARVVPKWAGLLIYWAGHS
jgi:hypothetical protein